MSIALLWVKLVGQRGHGSGQQRSGNSDEQRQQSRQSIGVDDGSDEIGGHRYQSPFQNMVCAVLGP